MAAITQITGAIVNGQNVSLEEAAELSGGNGALVTYTTSDGQEITGEQLRNDLGADLGLNENEDITSMRDDIAAGNIQLYDDQGNLLSADETLAKFDAEGPGAIAGHTILIHSEKYGDLTVKMGGNAQLDFGDDVITAAGDATAGEAAENGGKVVGEETNEPTGNTKPEGPDNTNNNNNINNYSNDEKPEGPEGKGDTPPPTPLTNEQYDNWITYLKDQGTLSIDELRAKAEEKGIDFDTALADYNALHPGAQLEP